MSTKRSSDCFFCGLAFPVSNQLKRKSHSLSQEEKNIALNLFCGILCSTDNFDPIRDALVEANSCGSCETQLRNLAASFQLMEQVKDNVAESAGELLKKMSGHFQKLMLQSVAGKVTGMSEAVREDLSFILKDIAETGLNDVSVEKIRASALKKMAFMEEKEEESQKNPSVSEKENFETERDVETDEGVETGDEQASKDTFLMPPPMSREDADPVFVPIRDESVRDEESDKVHIYVDNGEKDDNDEALKGTLHTPSPMSKADVDVVSVPVNEDTVSDRDVGGDKDHMGFDNGDKDDSDGDEDLSNDEDMGDKDDRDEDIGDKDDSDEEDLSNDKDIGDKDDRDEDIGDKDDSDEENLSNDKDTGDKDDSDEDEDLSNDKDISDDSDFEARTSSISDLHLPSEKEEKKQNSHHQNCLKDFMKRPTLQCPICRESLPSRGSLLLHLSLDHSPKRRTRPERNDLAETSVSDDEEEENPKNEQFQAEEFGDSQTTKSDEPATPEESVCVVGAATLPLQDKKLPRYVLLTQEKPDRKNNKEIRKMKQFQCPSCLKSYSVRGKLFLHLSIAHSQGKRRKPQDEDMEVSESDDDNLNASIASS